MGTPRITVEVIDKVLAFDGSNVAAARLYRVSRTSVTTWRSGDLPDFYRDAKAARGLPVPRGAPGEARRKYTVAQVEAVLAHEGTCAQVAAATGVSRETVGQWRAGRLPAFYVAAAAKPAVPVALAARRAARFVRPQDARAGR